MSEASLILQTSLRAMLIADIGVTSLVPAKDIYDDSDRPERFPCVLIGEDQVIQDTYALFPTIQRTQIFQTLHIYSRKPGLSETKKISGAIQRALRRTKLTTDDPDIVALCAWFSNARYLRDPDGETSHGIVTLEGRVQEYWSVAL